MRSPRNSAVYRSVTRPHVFLRPGLARAQRGLVEPGHVRGGDQRLDQLDHLGQGAGGLPQAGVDEPVGDLGPGHVGDQLPAPLDRDVLVHQQVDGQGAQPRADGQRRVRDAGRARRDMLAAARAPGGVHVVLDPPGPRLGDVQLLRRRRDPQVAGLAQVRPHGHWPCGKCGIVGPGPPSASPPRARRAACAVPLPSCPLLRPALLPRRRRPGTSSQDGGIGCSRCCGTAPV